MTFRPPRSLSNSPDAGLAGLEREILGEKADILGQAGQKVQRSIAALRDSDESGRTEALRDAARAVQAYFIQRELCGLRNHAPVIEQYAIPRAVLIRLGAC
ncbi:DUF6665 family protein [Sphingosinicella sp. BN140058]|uniref:DUF6665 family protein n=1 Tax=Sphingosinicella sp. BN140058 TaxID=1892855 RepID=UPI0010112E67|nr:DUF6665 family protein [Sphingosinicella sp. BN140058]QAY79195.1 hypothetical protein ETR14_23640 [Sphingosinicella sp. BN140058]